MEKKTPVKIFDIVIILLAVGLTVFSTIAVYITPAKTVQISIEGPNQQKWIYPLDAEETVRVKGILGEDTVIRIHNNEAWVESSPCGNQTCVGMGRVNSRGSWVACLPNNVYFVIEGSNDDGDQLDATVW